MDRVSSPARLAQIALITSLVVSPLAGCGTLVGAGAGGLVGHQFGTGNGNTAATIGGAAVGAVVGHTVTGD